MNQLEQISQDLYKRYEELLIERDNLNKDAASIQIAYNKTFGELECRSFSGAVACIRLKKQIDFCQRLINRGKSVDRRDLLTYTKKVMTEYYDILKEKFAEIDEARHSKASSTANVIEAKKLYHRLAKMLHPDLNPGVLDDPELKELWNRITAAYRANDVKELQELEVLAVKALEESGREGDRPEISDIEEKIAELRKEIETIRTTTPYTYHEILTDEEKIEAHRQDLKKEIQKYRNYEKDLRKRLRTYMDEYGVN